uniref:TSC complex subunit 1b n=1 Tax=Esox lucius TaxID=8010 RepID=A0A6Q2Z358_ESOLU
MSTEQPNIGDLLPQLESSDIRQLEEIKSLINENLSTERGSVLLNGLVDYYLENNSAQAMQILSSVREPHDKHLLDKMNDCMTKQTSRLSTLTLLGHVVRKQPSWIHKMARYPLLLSLLKCLKTDSDVVVLITGVLVLITLLPMIPQAGKQHLYEFFDIFGRLASWNLKNPGHVSEVYLIHLHASVYSLFHRLYGMYPCNFLSYLRSHYSMKENLDTFEEVVKPMLEHVRIHPELVTGTKDHELDPTRWKRFEIHDIVIECAKVSLDPKEASCEEGYATMPDHLYPHPQLRSQHSASSPYADFHSSYGQRATPLTHCAVHSQLLNPSCELPFSYGGKELWSPSSLCGMATPPSSRGISPNPELSHSASFLPGHRLHSASGESYYLFLFLAVFRNITFLFFHSSSLNAPITLPSHNSPAAITEELLKITEDKRDLAGLRGFDSPFFHTTETLTGTQGKPLAGLALGGPMLPREPHHSVSTPDRALEKAQGQNGDGDGSRSSPQEQSWSFQPVCPFSPIEHPLHQSPSAPEDEVAKVSDLFSPSPSMKNPSLPYEALFDLALPRAASLFIGRRTSEALGRAPQSDGLEDGEEQLGEGRVSASPLEVLDRLVQQGSDAHDKVLKRLPLPSKSADWTHFGGSAPLDELHTLRSQLLLLHNQLLYERYKREQHAVRNRRLLRRVINATALEEHNNAMKDQLSLQAVDMVSLRESLRVEQQRYRQLWEDRETVVTRLHSQIRQLQQGRDEYYTKNQGLQSKLNEYQKRMNELEADLQRANNKVCHTGHLLNQMTVKLSTSESTQQQMSFLNKQLLLLGEAHKLALQQPQPAGSNGAAVSGTKGPQMVQASWGKEAERLRQSLLLQGQKLEAAQQRVGELDIQLTKKEHLIAEQKKFLEDVKGQAKGELQASESRYQAQRRVTQLLQKELLQLYSRLEIERPACCTTASAAGGNGGGRGNGSTLSPWQPKANHPPASPSSNSVNGTEDVPPPLHAPPAPPPPPHDTAPLTVGSYPSAKSFLGMRARELFRNKSESQCDEEPPRLAGLSQGLKTELCVEPLWPTPGEAPCPASDPVLTVTPAAVSKPPPPVCVPAKEHPPDTRPRATKLDVPRRKMGGARGGAGPTAGAARPRQQQQLRIMDYNDMHQDRS